MLFEKHSSDYSKLSDEQLALRAKSDKQAVAELLARYVCSIEVKAKKFAYFLSEDLAQEGFIGLLNAVESFDENKNAKFSTYANVCIRNKMISAFDKQRNIQASDIDELVGEQADVPETIPENILVEKERTNEIYDKIISALSEQEWRVFQLFLTGLAYNQIALELNCPVKAVDNAMQRVRRKLKSVLSAGRV